MTVRVCSASMPNLLEYSEKSRSNSLLTTSEFVSIIWIGAGVQLTATCSQSMKSPDSQTTEACHTISTRIEVDEPVELQTAGPSKLSDSVRDQTKPSQIKNPPGSVDRVTDAGNTEIVSTPIAKRTKAINNNSSRGLSLISSDTESQIRKDLECDTCDTSSEIELDNLIAGVRESQFCINSRSCHNNSDVCNRSDRSLELVTTEFNTILEKNQSSSKAASDKDQSILSCSYDDRTDIFDCNIDDVTLPNQGSSQESDPESAPGLITLRLSSGSENSADGDACEKVTPNTKEIVSDIEILPQSDEVVVTSKAVSPPAVVTCVNNRSNRSIATTSLTDSQLCAIFDESDMTQIGKRSNGVDGFHASGIMEQNRRQSQSDAFELSPSAIAALNATFSPCLPVSHDASQSLTNSSATKTRHSLDKQDFSAAADSPDMSFSFHGRETYATSQTCDRRMSGTPADDSVEDLFQISSYQTTGSSITNSAESCKLSTLADRTFKLNQPAISQSPVLSDCDTDDDSVATYVTQKSKQSILPFENYAVVMATPNVVANTDMAKDLILSSQKDTQQYSNLRSSKVKVKKLKFENSDSAPVRESRRRDGVSHLEPENSANGPSVCAGESDSRVMQSPLSLIGDTASQPGLTIIDVCSHPELFNSFLKEWSAKRRFSMAIATRKEKV